MANPNVIILEAIYDYVAHNPGCFARDVLRAIGRKSGGLDGNLASMEGVNLLLTEDPDGRLYPFSRYGELNDAISNTA